MLESIFVGMSGLMGYSRGLRVIANNTANLNTPGFKGSALQFADMFYSGGGASGSGFARGQIGYGLNTYSTTLNFRPGEIRQTGNALDLAVDGQGLFVLRDASGQTRYSRDGQFQFDSNGILTSRGDASKVMGVDANGKLVEISLSGLRTNAARATVAVGFNGNLSSTATEQIVGGVRIFDGSGGAHELSLTFTNDSEAAAGGWKVAVMDGATAVGTGTIVFADGRPVAGKSKFSLPYKPAGQAATSIELDFSSDVTSFASGDLSTLAMAKQDGYGAGGLTEVAFDETGALRLTYANGQKVLGAKVALARFDSLDAVAAVGDNAFAALDEGAWHVGPPGDAFGAIRSGSIEISNVDLSQQFSDLVIMQRGYQASSQIVATANDMLQELFAMKGK